MKRLVILTVAALAISSAAALAQTARTDDLRASQERAASPQVYSHAAAPLILGVAY